jgi:hypothetical protein
MTVRELLKALSAPEVDPDGEISVTCNFADGHGDFEAIIGNKISLVHVDPWGVVLVTNS